VLLALKPLPIVFTAILPLELPVTVTLVLCKFTDVFFAVWPNKMTLAVHLVV
jgi:hypothetical protein